ncbi:MAG: hypothetical protein HUU35_13885, partial [Armatimonadetes bacterium]|nr:hypothetical protein [Armatimonadota bacterium]
MRRVVILAAAVAASVLAAPRAAVAQQTVDWTVLVYLNGDTSPGFTDLENASISDFNELEQVGSTSRVNIVCQWDRNDQTDNLDTYYADDSTQSWQGARRYLVTRDNNQTQNNLDPDEVNGNNGIEPNPGGNPAVGPHVGYRISSAALLDLGEVDMGQEQTLVDFCQWSFARFPARHYLLILNDTGRGWQPRSVRPGRGRGLMFDASTTGDASDNNAAVYLTNDELRSALTRVKALNGGTNLDIVALDAGGQGVLEVVYQLRDTADYVVAPFLERPLDGFPYDRWLSTLVNSMPLDTTNIETMLGNYIADYFGSYLPGNTILGGSRSTAAGAFRMAQIEAVRLAVDNLAQALLDDLPTYATGILRALAQVQRGRTTDYTANYLDLVHFANLIAAEIDDPPVDNAAAAVPPAVTALLVNTTFGSSITGDLSLTNFNGVGIYFPADISNFDVNYSVSGDLVDATQWDELVQGVLTLNSDQRGPEIVIGSPLAGSTIIDNPPQVIATIVDLEAGGRINPQSITVQIDGQTIPSSDYTFDATTGVLTYDIPNPLSVTSHTVTISARDLSGNLTSVTSSFRVAVPSLPVGVQTFSLPRVVTQAENNPALIFGSGNFTLVRWVPLLLGANKYRTYPDSYASFIPPDALPT